MTKFKFLFLTDFQAVQPSTGDIIHDSFEDNSSRSELETRLAHIQPVEILISHNVSEATEKLVTGLQAIRYPFCTIFTYIGQGKENNQAQNVNIFLSISCCMCFG